MKDVIFALMVAVLALPTIEVGQPLSSTAQFAGPWEERVGRDEVAGFSLLLITDKRDNVRLVRIDTYVRRDQKTTNTYWSNGSAGEFALENGRLRFHQAPTESAPFDVSLDLTYDPVEVAWKGTFANPLFSGSVDLRRPNMSAPGTPAGTWRTRLLDDRDDACFHIGVGQDDALVIWSESHDSYGGSFGVLFSDPHAHVLANVWSFDAGNLNGGDHISGVLRDNTSFVGTSKHYGNGVYSRDPSKRTHEFTWDRMATLDCRP